jgi:hypothetical protein
MAVKSPNFVGRNVDTALDESNSMQKEAQITIDGIKLTDAEAMVVRVAVGAFKARSWCSD